MLISQTYPRRFATAEDLGDQPHTLPVARVTTEQVGPARKPVIWFFGAKKGIIMGPRLARQIAAILGDDTARWTGRELTLHTVPCRGLDGRPTRSIHARPTAAQPVPAPTLELSNSRTLELPLRNPAHRVEPIAAQA